jgi:hypothetical protein
MIETRTEVHRSSTVAMAVGIAVAIASFVLYPPAADVARAAGRKDLLASDFWFIFPLVALTFSATGLVIHRHGPNLVGWVMHGIGLSLASGVILQTLSIYDGVGRDLGVTGRVLGAWSDFSWIPGLVLMTVFLPLLFPTGRPPSRRWWWVAGIGAAGVVYAFATVTLEAATGVLYDILSESASSVIVSVLMVTGTLGATASVVVRYRRAGDVERHQIKWVSASLLLVCSVAAFAVSPPARDLLTGATVPLVGSAVWCTIPVSIGIAITRYHLYDIDRIVSRTVSYALVGLIVGLIYAGVVVALGSILGSRGDLAIAASTLAAAAVFRPVRRRIQHATDRRFNRPRYQAQRELDAFAQHLRGQVELAAVSDDLIRVVERALQPSSLDLWIRTTR